MTTFAKAQQVMVEYLGSAEFAGLEDAHDTVPQVRFLQDINRNGFLTIDSQQGSDNALDLERAYVCGFMRPNHYERALHAMNQLRSDKLLLNIPVATEKDFKARRIPLTIDKRTHEAFTTNAMFVPSMDFRFLKKQAGLKPGEAVLLVLAMDPKWGRAATSKQGLYHDLIRALKMSLPERA